MNIVNFIQFSLNEGTQGAGNKFILVRFGNSMHPGTAKYFNEIAVKNPKPVLMKGPGSFITMFETSLTKEGLIQGFDQLGISYNLYQIIHTSAGGAASSLVARKPNKAQLEAKLAKAVEDENYELATQLRNQIAELEGHPAPAAGPSESRVHSFESFLFEDEVNGTTTEEFNRLVSELVDHELAEIESGEEEKEEVKFSKKACQKIKDYLVANNLYVAKEKSENSEKEVKQQMNEDQTEGFRAYKIPDDKRDAYFKFKDKLDSSVGPKIMSDSNWDAYSDPIIKIGDISVFSKQNQDAIVSFMKTIGAKDVTEMYND